jgi:myosin V
MVVAWKSEGLGQLAAGSAIWYRLVTKADPETLWQPGTLVAVGPDSVQVQTQGRKARIETVPLQDAEPANPDILSATPDLTALTQLNEPSILHALTQRYGTDVIYTTAGPVLIALNPCKHLPLYESRTVDEYRRVQTDLDASAKAPHIFLNAGKAFRDMVDNQLVRPALPLAHEHSFRDQQASCGVCRCICQMQRRAGAV